VLLGQSPFCAFCRAANDVDRARNVCLIGKDAREKWEWKVGREMKIMRYVDRLK
jgi:hypothetical protein